MRIEADIDGGNVIVHARRARHAVLGIRHDTGAEDYRQWFHFRVHGLRGATFELVELDRTTYPDAWEGYDVCISRDGERWVRAPSELDGDTLRFELEEPAETLHVAYFAPYSTERHRALLAHAAREARVRTLGRTVQGRSMDIVTLEGGPRHVWIIARQHPGETMGEWFAEGLLGRLFAGDPVTRALREAATIHVVPNMNPDGSALGNLRANAAGRNLNRAWLEPDDASPEVAAVRAAMEHTGVDLFLDVHGDERNPWCFLAGCEGNPNYDDRLRHLENVFEQALVEDNEDFQDEYGYPRDEPGEGDLTTASNWVGARFDCLSFTLEMPFKDAANRPDPEVGWDPDRARRLGGSTIDAIAATLPDIA